MSHEFAQILETLAGIMRQVFRRPDMVVDATATSQTLAGWDSFRYVEIIVALEAAYGIELDGPEIDEVRNVGDLCRLVQRKEDLLF